MPAAANSALRWLRFKIDPNEIGITGASAGYQVNSPKMPFLLIHGDADLVVPLAHSEKLVKAIRTSGGSAELIIKKGGGHPWLTISEEVLVIADWFDKQLK